VFLGVHAQSHIHASRKSGFEKLVGAETPIAAAIVRSGVRRGDLFAVGKMCEVSLGLTIRVNHDFP
jgi:hypothetical protein